MSWGGGQAAPLAPWGRGVWGRGVWGRGVGSPANQVPVALSWRFLGIISCVILLSGQNILSIFTNTGYQYWIYFHQ